MFSFGVQPQLQWLILLNLSLSFWYFFIALLMNSQLKCETCYGYSVTLNTVCVFVDCKMRSQSAHTHTLKPRCIFNN